MWSHVSFSSRGQRPRPRPTTDELTSYLQKRLHTPIARHWLRLISEFFACKTCTTTAKGPIFASPEAKVVRLRVDNARVALLCWHHLAIGSPSGSATDSNQSSSFWAADLPGILPNYRLTGRVTLIIITCLKNHLPWWISLAEGMYVHCVVYPRLASSAKLQPQSLQRPFLLYNRNLEVE